MKHLCVKFQRVRIRNENKKCDVPLINTNFFPKNKMLNLIVIRDGQKVAQFTEIHSLT